MNEHAEELVVGEYFLAVEGFAMIRHCLTTPSATKARVDEIRDLATKLDEFPNSLTIPLTEYAVEDGYTQWAPRYDRPNPAIACETPRRFSSAAPLANGCASLFAALKT